MFAIAFDLIVADTEKNHPKGVSQAYTDIATSLLTSGFRGCRAVSISPTMKTWQTCSRRCKD